MAVVVARIDHASDWGRWTLVRARPAAALAGLAVEYQGYRESAPWAVLRRETPASVFPLILNLGAPFRVHDPGGAWTAPEAGFVAGLHDRSVLVASPGRAHCLQIDLTPPGRAPAVPPRPRRAAQPDAPRRGSARARRPGAAGRARRGAVLGRAFARVDAFLLARVADSRPVTPAIAWAWEQARRLRRAAAGGGGSPATPGLSRQGLLDGFRREIGAAPKLAARILRFERAMRLIAARPAIGLAELALACGYADQPHLNRELRAFAATSPTALRAALLPDGTGLMAPAA